MYIVLQYGIPQKQSFYKIWGFRLFKNMGTKRSQKHEFFCCMVGICEFIMTGQISAQFPKEKNNYFPKMALNSQLRLSNKLAVNFANRIVSK